MYVIVKTTRENVRFYDKKTRGKEIIDIVDSLDKAFNKISIIEDNDFYPRDGFVYDSNDNEVYDPKYPDTFEFGDYTYHIKPLDKLDDIEEEILGEMIITGLIITEKS